MVQLRVIIKHVFLLTISFLILFGCNNIPESKCNNDCFDFYELVLPVDSFECRLNKFKKLKLSEACYTNENLFKFSMMNTPLPTGYIIDKIGIDSDVKDSLNSINYLGYLINISNDSMALNSSQLS